jgi:hypothetical protein
VDVNYVLHCIDHLHLGSEVQAVYLAKAFTLRTSSWFTVFRLGGGHLGCEVNNVNKASMLCPHQLHLLAQLGYVLCKFLCQAISSRWIYLPFN